MAGNFIEPSRPWAPLLRYRLATAVAPISRVAEALRPAGTRASAPVALDIAAARGATDAELARLDRRSAESDLDDLRAMAPLAVRVGIVRLR